MITQKEGAGGASGRERPEAANEKQLDWDDEHECTAALCDRTVFLFSHF